MNADEKKEESLEEEIQAEASPDNTVPLNAPTAAEQKLREELLYVRADFDNAKRRLLREQDNAIRFANEKVFGELLNTVDLFERALTSATHLKDSADAKSFYTGIEMTHRELVNLLSKFGVELTGAVGEKFDPSRHEAVSQTPVDDEQVDTVTAVVQRGGSFQGRCLKPARVVVGISREN